MVDGMWADRDTPGVGSSGLKPSRAIVAYVVLKRGKDQLDLVLASASSLGLAVVISLSKPKS